jgi:hypoxanthine phosphoribosyltransferase
MDLKDLKVLIDEKTINSRIKELANEIYSHYPNKRITTITVLEGAKPFSRKLRNELSDLGIEVEDHEIKVSSYGVGQESTGNVKVVKGLEYNIEGKDVLILEDILDTGHTLNFLSSYLSTEKKAKSVKIAVLVDKPERRVKEVKTDYIGFTIPNKFIVGFGMDFEENFRDLPYIGFFE